ncbi:MAG: transglutaminase domain-containing protein, partial [Acholeplasmataceae bacterium]
MKRIIIVGGVALLTIFLVVSYSLFSLFGITQTRVKRVDLTISTASDFKVYDGAPLSNPTWAIKSGKLNKNDSIQVTMSSSITAVGSIENEIGVTIFNENDLDVTNNYNIKYDLGNLVVSGLPLAIYTGSSTKMYEGKPLSNQEWYIVSGTLRENDRIEVNMPIKITLPEVVSNEIFVTIYDDKNKDVTKIYDIKYHLGEVSVLKIPIVLKSNSEKKVYDGDILTNNDYDILNGEVLDGHSLVVDVVGEITGVGRTENLMHAYVVDEFGKNVSHYYEFTYFTGILEVQSSIYSSETISKEAPKEDHNPVLKVFSTESGPIYLRDRSSGLYNLQGFDSGVSYQSSFFFNPLSLTNRALLKSGFTSKIVEIEYLRAQLPYLLPYYVSDLLEGQNDVEYKRPVSTFQNNEYVSFDYINSTVSLNQDETLLAFEENYRSFVYEEYLKLPESTRTVMLAIASNNALDPSSDTIIQDVKNYIQNAAVYNMDFSRIPDDVEDIAAYFLLISKEGVCQHFATAATVMYRALGIPARYTTGYLAKAEKDQWITVTGMN